MLNEERSFSSLEEVTKLLIAAEGKTFRELDETGRGDSVGNKGSLGNIIEESVLHYPVNSDAEADILVGNTRYELKVTPLKHSGKGKRMKTVAKERLVLDIINYEDLPGEKFEDSRFWNKSKNIIMVYYYDDREDKRTQSRLDCKVLKAVVLHYDENDLATIRNDWETIHEKVVSGHADQLSESDTNYLAACTKGANASSMRDAPAPAGSGKARIRAKQRAFSFKSSFMTSIAERALVSRIEEYSLPIPSNQTLSEFLWQQMSPYIGRSVDDIALRLGISKSDSKASKSRLVMKMVGAEGRSVDTIEQFRKASVTKLKTVVLYPDGLPKESMSFRQITEEEWRGLASFDAKWEDSFLYEYFEENKFFIVPFESPVPYSQHVAGNDRLVGGFLWNMPEKDIEQYVRPVWERLHELMLSGGSVHYGRGTNLLPGASFNGVCHLRPKGQNSDDVVRLPNGESITKQCFWLDRHYVAKLIRENQKVNGRIEGHNGRKFAEKRQHR